MSLVYVSPLLHNTWLPLDLHGRSRDFPGGKAWDASRHEVNTYFVKKKRWYIVMIPITHNTNKILYRR